MTPAKNDLVTFLYILLRDHLPAGTVEDIMRNHVAKSRGQTSVYSSRHVHGYALELAARLTGCDQFQVGALVDDPDAPVAAPPPKPFMDGVRITREGDARVHNRGCAVHRGGSCDCEAGKPEPTHTPSQGIRRSFP
jgi:hypothetical protein